MTDRPHVRIVATGGTIANPPDVEGYLPGAQLVENIPELEDVAELTVDDVASVGSSAMSPAIWQDLHAAVREAVEDGVDGVVVTHGSNTLEETAYFLDLTLGVERPVVLTAAQRNHRTIGNDGDRNLLDAVRVAAHSDAVGRGVLVAVNDEVHAARDVTKTVSGRPDAWTSAPFGAVGLVDKYGLVQFYRRSDRSHAPHAALSPSSDAEAFPRVEVIYSVAGADGSMIDAAVANGVDGLVVAALPTGTLAKPQDGPRQHDALERAVDAGVPVAISHRGLEGWPKPWILHESPFIWADTLRPQKAHILLALGLLETDDPDRLQELFLEH